MRLPAGALFRMPRSAVKNSANRGKPRYPVIAATTQFTVRSNTPSSYVSSAQRRKTAHVMYSLKTRYGFA